MVFSWFFSSLSILKCLHAMHLPLRVACMQPTHVAENEPGPEAEPRNVEEQMVVEQLLQEEVG